MQEVSQQRRIWWGCQALSRQPATQRVAFFNAPLLESLNTSSLLVFTPCSQSPRRSMTAKNKKHYSLVLFVHFLPFSFFRFSPILFLVKLGLVKAQSTYFWNKQRHSESLQVSGESCQVWGFSVFPFFFFFFRRGRKDVSSLAEEYAFVGCRRLTHCRSFGNKPGWVYSPGSGRFSHHCSNPPAFLL